MFNFYCEPVAYHHLYLHAKMWQKNILVITPDQNDSDSLVQIVTRVTMELPQIIQNIEFTDAKFLLWSQKLW
jgi:hypothetical protein